MQICFHKPARISCATGPPASPPSTSKRSSPPDLTGACAQAGSPAPSAAQSPGGGRWQGGRITWSEVQIASSELKHKIPFIFLYFFSRNWARGFHINAIWGKKFKFLYKRISPVFKVHQSSQLLIFQGLHEWEVGHSSWIRTHPLPIKKPEYFHKALLWNRFHLMSPMSFNTSLATLTLAEPSGPPWWRRVFSTEPSAATTVLPASKTSWHKGEIYN